MAEVYSRKGQIVEANRLTRANGEAVALWCGGHYLESSDAFKPEEKFAEVNLRTPDGPARASEGDYIVKTPAEEFHVLKEHEFLRTYEPILNPSAFPQN